MLGIQDSADRLWPAVPVGLSPGSSKIRTGAIPLRIALYSHDTMGLGHLRRNLRIAQALRRSPLEPGILLISGTRIARTFNLPPGIDCLTLPALYKQSDGRYRSRSLEMPLHELIALRARIMQAALAAYRPSVLIVDNVPRGAQCELDAVLAELRATVGTRCVLGLRDILDEPDAVRREWTRRANEQAISEFYDAVWVYGDPLIYDLTREYRLADAIRDRVRFTGYLDSRVHAEDEKSDGSELASIPPGQRLALCLLGGGQDGARLAETFCAARLPADMLGLILTGPYLPDAVQQRLRARMADNPRLRVLEFVNAPLALLHRADRVVAMGGYNTVYELLSHAKHSLIVPRVRPRQEQLIRARRLHELGLIDMLHPDQLDADRLGAWFADENNAPRVPRHPIDFDGLDHLPRLLAELLAVSPDAATAR